MDSLTACDRVSLFGGGLPIIFDGQMVGAIGVSGSSEKGDESCAQAAIDEVFGEMKNEQN